MIVFICFGKPHNNSDVDYSSYYIDKTFENGVIPTYTNYKN